MWRCRCGDWTWTGSTSTQLHRVDPTVPTAESLGVLAEMQTEGMIRNIGLSNVSAEQLAAARTQIDVVTVQNRYNLGDRSSEQVLGACESSGIGFIPWFPVAAGPLAHRDGPVAAIAARMGIPAAQLSQAWLLRRSPVMLPIPGTSSVTHLEENCAAIEVELDDDTYAELSGVAGA